MAYPPAPGSPGPYGAPPPPPEKNNRTLFLTLGVVGAVVLLLCCGGVVGFAVWASNKDDNSGDSALPTPSVTYGVGGGPTTASGGGAPTDSAGGSAQGKIGTAVRQGDLEITVTSAPRCGVKSIGSGYLTTTSEKGQFCLIDLKFTNTGQKALRPTLFGCVLIDGQGGETTRSYSSDYANPNNNLLLDDNIYPGKTVTGVVAFDIPSDQKPAKLELNPVGEYDDLITIDLT